MKNNYDEPMFIDVKRGRVEEEEGPAGVEEAIRNLCDEQSFAVLATQGQGQPYATLISFATSPDMKYAIFATPIQTRKYSLIQGDQMISMLIDNRSSQPNSLNSISALTITGKAKALSDEESIELWSGLLLCKHPYLSHFVKSPSTALIVVEVTGYFYVRRFQEVFQWSP
ncbi:pyridoxamine 5'-phosphate oxidase (plasmid) [Peptoclostridium acidaminophilum DSM 3953]|uniref:Pyridoxamine 5'-phosphate oxidase n=1 Tax=Peptoclostridium acidaminophilum DSM 3953 TaxID=1286171 RepID=W8T7N9_PEPAC|nr:pyridoxamine 5'-phosphate oxidase family protein [Peptoclostridium acidaminophilum]AHM57744.1 pyridoxamine 5'-phosphate oxidase [Peptoclostridium acidaminophilum DSM 3953]